MGMSCLDCHDYMDGFNRGKKEGTIEELEKIKSEIEDLLFSYGYLDIHTNNDVLEIINKRIAELKGKNNLTCERNICLKNEYSNIGCEDCVVTKGE